MNKVLLMNICEVVNANQPYNAKRYNDLFVWCAKNGVELNCNWTKKHGKQIVILTAHFDENVAPITVTDFVSMVNGVDGLYLITDIYDTVADVINYLDSKYNG